MKKHVLVTGGAGFIGSHLVDTLLARAYQVTVLDNLSPQVHGDAELDDDGWPVYLDPRARRIRGDLLDEGVFEQSIEGVTHLAPSGRLGGRRPEHRQYRRLYAQQRHDRGGHAGGAFTKAARYPEDCGRLVNVDLR